MSAFSDQQQASVPLIIGYNADEASLFVDFIHPAGGEFEAPQSGEPGHDRRRARDVRAVVPDTRTGRPADGGLSRSRHPRPRRRSRRSSATTCSVSTSITGRASTPPAGHPVYRYHFRAVPPSKKQTAGAFHAAEIFYVFDSALPLVPVAVGRPPARPGDGRPVVRVRRDRRARLAGPRALARLRRRAIRSTWCSIARVRACSRARHSPAST